MIHQATKISIIAEKLIQDGIIKIIEDAGATGYTVIDGGGKGHHGLRSTERAAVVGGFAIVKIEVITADAKTAEAIATAVANTYFTHHSGIVYMEEVKVLRPQKF